MKRLFPAAMAVVALTACSPQKPAAVKSDQPSATTAPAAQSAPAAAQTKAPAGAYTLDPAHTSVIFRVDHLGLSRYTGRFTKVDGRLQFDPAKPETMAVSVTIDPRSLQTDYPEPKKLDFDAQVQRQFLDVARFADLAFRSTKVEPTGPATATVTGDLTLHGVTRPATLNAKFNGGYPAGGMDPSGARIGFSAHGTFKRSDFGIAFGLPAPGTTMGVGDAIEVVIETEFTQPGPAAPPPKG